MLIGVRKIIRLERINSRRGWKYRQLIGGFACGLQFDISHALYCYLTLEENQEEKK